MRKQVHMENPHKQYKESHSFTGTDYTHDMEDMVVMLLGPRCSSVDQTSIALGDIEHHHNQLYTIDLNFILKAF
jgi:hypothetical protein